MVSYNGLIGWLEKILKDAKVRQQLGVPHIEKEEDISCYRGLEYSDEFKKDIQIAQSRGVKFHIDPALPVDLVMVAKTKEEEDTGGPEEVNYYWVFWIILSRDEGLKKRLLFYQFYLSRVSEPRRVKMIIVTANDAPSDLMSNLREIAEEGKFGLWTADVAKEEPTPILQPKTFREKMVEEFREPIDKEVKANFPEGIRNRAEDLAMFFDSYVRDAVEAIVGITPEEAGKRYIDRRVLDLAFELEKVSYGQKVQELVTEHLSKKTNDYDFVTNAFASLWKACNLEILYSDFLKTFEPALYHLSAGGGRTYRDHYLHQFQVFLLGLHIIDKFHDKLNFDEMKEKQWLVACSFHDVAYPVQLYDGWSKEFFEKVFSISDVGVADLKSHFIDKTLLSSMGYMIDSLCTTHLNRTLTGNWLDNEKKLVQFFYKKITMVKHHCVLSAISLLKKASALGLESSLLKEVFAPAALAILLHDKEVWKELKEQHDLAHIEFDMDPIAFLLLFCDCIQEWGRPKEADSAADEKQRFLLDKLEKSDNKYSLTIWTPYLKSTEPTFRKKEAEGKELEDILLGPKGVEFEMNLADSSRNVKKTCTIPSKTC
jgi:hypothetical protein